MSWDRDIATGVARGVGGVGDVPEFFAELLGAREWVAEVATS